MDKIVSYAVSALVIMGFLTSCKNPTISPSWVVSTIAVGTSGFANGVGTEARFNYPRGVAVDKFGNIYVADTGNSRIRKITSTGALSTIAGTAFSSPSGIAVDESGNIYVADTGNSRIRKITSTGALSTIAGTTFSSPTGIAVDESGNIYVADTGNSRIRKITSTGALSTIAGTEAQLRNPYGVAVDSSGNIYVGDIGNHRIWRITVDSSGGNANPSTLAGDTSGFADGVGTEARFRFPYSVAVDFFGNVYVADTNNHRIRKISPAGEVSTIAGSTSGFADGTGSEAQFSQPSGIAVDSSGNIYVADAYNHRIRKIEYKVP